MQELRIVHRHSAPDRFCNDAIPVLNRFVENRGVSESVTYRINRAMDIKVGDAFGEVIRFFESKPFTKHEVIAGYQAGLNAGDDVSTLWGMVQGFTAAAKSIPYANSKVDLERRAGLLLN